LGLEHTHRLCTYSIQYQHKFLCLCASILE
jgi:hypothetical protein